jgi:DNA-binding transcriptional LysR family regulator
MEVTPAARGVMLQAESMLSNATAIERHLAGLDREMSGVVRIAATEGIAVQWLVPRLAELRRLHSDVIVQVIVGDQVLDLATRQADLAIRFFRPTSNQIVAARVGNFGMSIFASPGYAEKYGMPQSLAELDQHQIVDHTSLHNLAAMKPWTEAAERSTKIVFRTNSSHSAMEAVVAGWGLSVFPSYSSKNIALVEAPIDLNIVRDIWLVSHEETNKGARIRAVIDYIREQFRRDEREWFSVGTRPNSMAAA